MPKKLRGPKLDEVVHTRVVATVKDRWEQAAENIGLSLSAFVRHSVEMRILDDRDRLLGESDNG